jgi:hypothetical protein
MIMRRFAKIAAAYLGTVMFLQATGQALPVNRLDTLSFKDKLEQRVDHFETDGRTLVESVLNIAFEHELPVGIEYLNREALTHPIDLRFQKQSIREILKALAQQIPEYQITFSDGLVDIFIPRMRQDPSNLLNTVIKDFKVSDLDAAEANAELACALAQEIDPSRVCLSSIARGQLGTQKITIHMRNARVYELIHAIVARNGKSVWTVIVPPSRLIGSDSGDLWHIYPLQAPFKEAVLEKLSNLKP